MNISTGVSYQLHAREFQLRNMIDAKKLRFKDKCEEPSYRYVIAAGDWKTEVRKGEEKPVSSALLTHTSCVETL